MYIHIFPFFHIKHLIIGHNGSRPCHTCQHRMTYDCALKWVGQEHHWHCPKRTLKAGTGSSNPKMQLVTSKCFSRVFDRVMSAQTWARNGSVILQYVGTYPPAIPIATALWPIRNDSMGEENISYFFQPLVYISRFLFAEWTCQSKGVFELGSFGRFSLGDFNHMCILTLWLMFLLYQDEPTCNFV
jgi:hypothetical protein